MNVNHWADPGISKGEFGVNKAHPVLDVTVIS